MPAGAARAGQQTAVGFYPEREIARLTPLGVDDFVVERASAHLAVDKAVLCYDWRQRAGITKTR
jgi:hypothetical protein